MKRLEILVAQFYFISTAIGEESTCLRKCTAIALIKVMRRAVFFCFYLRRGKKIKKHIQLVTLA